MIYPIHRFIRTDLAWSLQQFCAHTHWQQSLLQHWQKLHLPVDELPIALLADLSSLSLQELSITETLEKLWAYEEDYYRYIMAQRNLFSRIPNAPRYLKDLSRFSPTVGKKSILATTSALDHHVYLDLFTPREEFDNKVLHYQLSQEEHHPQVETIAFKFLVKILQAPNGHSLPFYEYQGLMGK